MNDDAKLHPNQRAPLAYENEKFLNGPDGRILRILAEYQEPLSKFRRERIQDTIVFFGSARFRSRETTKRRSRRCAPRAAIPPRHRSSCIEPNPISRCPAITKTRASWPS